jgi:hypothetical protein
MSEIYFLLAHFYGDYDAATMDMETLDQLSKTYADMSEDELVAIAADARDLTDAARKVLRNEMSRRGLDMEVKITAAVQTSSAERPELGPPEADQLEEVATVWNADEARKLQKLLSDSGIPFYLGHDNVENVDSFHGSFEHGVDVKVAVDDMKAAIMLIENNPDAAPAESVDDVQDSDDDSAQFVMRCPSATPKPWSWTGANHSRASNENSIRNTTGTAMTAVINGRMKALRKSSDRDRSVSEKR